MKVALDVHYDGDVAYGAGVVFDAWEQAAASAVVCQVSPSAAPYEPGEFYLRELPCILGLLKRIGGEPSTVIVDGYVDLGASRPGLGRHLWNTLERRSAVVGVAKSPFDGAEAVEVVRGQSRRPLYVTAAGWSAQAAAHAVVRMAGDFRIPALLKLADRAARDAVPA